VEHIMARRKLLLAEIAALTLAGCILVSETTTRQASAAEAAQRHTLSAEKLANLDRVLIYSALE
jgi:outer membrane lipoprotein SlyB